MYEEAYGHFVQDVARRLADEAARERLAAILPGSDAHVTKLEDHAARIGGRLAGLESPDVVASGLADVVDVERAAREFYLRHADDVHDPELRRLFHELAKEDRAHAETAEAVLDDYRARHRIQKEQPHVEDNGALLWEGAGDLSPKPRRIER